MLTCVTEIGLFFKYSPKRAQLLEFIIIAENMKREPSKKMNTTKIKLFCETRWTQRHVVLEEIHIMYEHLLKTLEKITTERGWDNKATDSAHSLMKSLNDPTFLVGLNVCSYVLGFMKPLSIMLQATAMDVITAYQNIRLVKDQLKTFRDNTDKVFEDVWTRATKLATIAEVELTSPRVCSRMTKELIFQALLLKNITNLQYSYLQLII